MKKNKGFTLIELMITVAIMGILMGIVFPNYKNYILRSQVVEATSNLSILRTKMEQYYQENRTYAGACTNGTLAPIPSGLKYFNITCSNLGEDTYTLTATGISNGFTYSVDQLNQRATLSTSNWGTSTSCWIINNNGTCQ